MAVSIGDIERAAARLRSHLTELPSPARSHATLSAACELSLVVKHDNLLPTGSFKVRNGLSAMTALAPEALARGVVAASRGNHGLGLAHAGALLGAAVTICVPIGNNPEKNAAMRGFGARVVEEGRDYDEAVEVAARFVAAGATLIHSTNNDDVIAGAGTVTTEFLAQVPSLQALVVAVGGGSQAMGAIIAARALAPHVEIFGVQAEGAPAFARSFAARAPRELDHATTIADGLATRKTYAHTFATLLEGLRDVVTVSEAELRHATHAAITHTHTLVEPAGAAGLAGALKLRDRLRGKTVGVIFSGANIATTVLAEIFA